MKEELKYCITCGTPYYSNNPLKFHCSHACKIAKMNITKKEKIEIHVYCKHCNKLFKRRQKVNVFCSKECNINSRKQNLSHSQWLNIAEYVRERDNYKCTQCSADTRIEIHHIVPIYKGGTNDYDNLISLCQKCHIEEHKRLLNN